MFANLLYRLFAVHAEGRTVVPDEQQNSAKWRALDSLPGSNIQAGGARLEDDLWQAVFIPRAAISMGILETSHAVCNNCQQTSPNFQRTAYANFRRNGLPTCATIVIHETRLLEPDHHCCSARRHTSNKLAGPLPACLSGLGF